MREIIFISLDPLPSYFFSLKKCGFSVTTSACWVRCALAASSGRSPCRAARASVSPPAWARGRAASPVGALQTPPLNPAAVGGERAALRGARLVSFRGWVHLGGSGGAGDPPPALGSGVFLGGVCGGPMFGASIAPQAPGSPAGHPRVPFGGSHRGLGVAPPRPPSFGSLPGSPLRHPPARGDPAAVPSVALPPLSLHAGA